MTGNFKEFKVENHGNENWDENNAVTSTAVCIALIPNIVIYKHVYNCFQETNMKSHASGLPCKH